MNGTMRHLSYLRYILAHKWFVLVECVKMGIIWQGIVHDLSKMTPREFLPYARFFYNPDGSWKHSKFNRKSEFNDMDSNVSLQA